MAEETAAEATETEQATETTETETTQATETTETASDHWSAAIEDEGLRGVASKYDDHGTLLKALGVEAPKGGEGDWRAAIGDEKLREHAGRFTTLEDLVKANLDSRQKLSKAITPPGKDAKPEDVAAYRKAIGVPEDPAGYKFPDAPKGEELSDEVKAEREAWAKTFHELDVPAKTAEALIAKVNEAAEAQMQAQIEADKKFVEETDQALRNKWGGDFDRNTKAAERAAMQMAERAGINVDDLRHMETKDGKFVLDHPLIRQLLAPIGLEMAEGNLGPALTDAERSGINDQIDGLQKQIETAQAGGKSKEANELYQKKLALIEKRDGAQPVVGARGRAA